MCLIYIHEKQSVLSDSKLLKANEPLSGSTGRYVCAESVVSDWPVQFAQANKGRQFPHLLNIAICGVHMLIFGDTT